MQKSHEKPIVVQDCRFRVIKVLSAWMDQPWLNLRNEEALSGARKFVAGEGAFWIIEIVAWRLLRYNFDPQNVEHQNDFWDNLTPSSVNLSMGYKHIPSKLSSQVGHM